MTILSYFVLEDVLAMFANLCHIFEYTRSEFFRSGLSRWCWLYRLLLSFTNIFCHFGWGWAVSGVEDELPLDTYMDTTDYIFASNDEFD